MFLSSAIAGQTSELNFQTYNFEEHFRSNQFRIFQMQDGGRFPFEEEIPEPKDEEKRICYLDAKLKHNSCQSNANWFYGGVSIGLAMLALSGNVPVAGVGAVAVGVAYNESSIQCDRTKIRDDDKCDSLSFW